MRPIVVFVLFGFFAGGCAAHHQASLADRLVHQGEPSVRLDPKGAGAQPAEESLQAVMEKVRQLSVAMRPTQSGTAVSVETDNTALAAALAREAAAPGADTHRAVGDLYLQLGVLDLAYSHFAQAVKADPRDAGSYEQLARVWRNWGFANLGLGDAYRAVYYAPAAPSAHNTLGTLLQALGRPALALEEYRRALALAPDAAYALNNACSALLEMNKPADALASCQRAVQLDPASIVAQRNLAAARAAQGRTDSTAAAAAGNGVASPTHTPVAPHAGGDDSNTARPAANGSRPTGFDSTTGAAGPNRR